MIRQCCSTFTDHLPAVENTWRPRWDGEDYETYRQRIVDKGDGDIFRGLQLLEQALQRRTELLLSVLEGADGHVAEIRDQAQALSLEARRVPPRVFPVGARGHAPRPRLQVGACARCRCAWVRRADETGQDLCDICTAIHDLTSAWAPQMPTKAIKSGKKKRRKKKKRAPAAAPTHADLHDLLERVPDLKQKIQGQPPLTSFTSSAQRAWQSPFDDPYLRWPNELW